MVHIKTMGGAESWSHPESGKYFYMHTTNWSKTFREHDEDLLLCETRLVLFLSSSLVCLRTVWVQENSSVEGSVLFPTPTTHSPTPPPTSWEAGDLSDCPSFVSVSRLWGAQVGQSHSFYSKDSQQGCSSTFPLLPAWEDTDGCCRRLKMFPFMLFFFFLPPLPRKPRNTEIHSRRSADLAQSGWYLN